jgi:hypothetical protein
MHEYLLRVRHHDGAYTATLRELSPAHPDERISFGPTHIGTGATHPAAVLAAVTNARLPHFTEPRRSPYAI